MPAYLAAHVVHRDVSIRTRPFGRVMRRGGRVCRWRSARFNPHPAFRPGDAPRPRPDRSPARVSIRTRPFGRVMPSAATATKRCRRVSIRTRPFGRVMPSHMSPVPNTLSVSIRTRPFGRVMPGTEIAKDQLYNVSIRTRPFGRVMRNPAAPLRADLRFNPHPAFRPGDARHHQSQRTQDQTFQSAPGLSAG